MRYITASGVSSVTPRPPCTWIARSMTSLQHARGVELDQRDLDARLVALVEPVRRLQRHQPARLDLGRRLRDPVLHRLLVGERARRTPCARARTSTSARRRAASGRASASRGGSGPGPRRFCAIRKPSPGSPSVFATGTRTSGEARLAVRRPAVALVSHHRDLAARARSPACRSGRGSSTRACAAPRRDR